MGNNNKNCVDYYALYIRDLNPISTDKLKVTNWNYSFNVWCSNTIILTTYCFMC